jgi:hypothetical protein
MEKQIMPRAATRADDLASIERRREALQAELTALDARAKAIETAAKDAGRPVLMAALKRIQVGAVDKADARAIASAIAVHGGSAVAKHMASLA